MPDLTTLAPVKSWLQLPQGEIQGLADGTLVEGSGYHPATTTVSLASVIGQGSGFAADPIIVAGKFKGIVIRVPGSLYSKEMPPALVITDTDIAPGSGAGASLNIAAVDSAHDAELTRLISAASAFIYQGTSRNALIGPVTVTEKRDGHNGTSRIATKEFPVTAVASVTNNGTVVPVSTGPLGSGYGFDETSIFLRGSAYWCGFANVTLVYSAGYAVGSPEAAMLEQAAIVLAGTWYRRRLHMDETSRAIGGGGAQIASYSQRDVPAEVATVIQNFLRPMVFG